MQQTTDSTIAYTQAEDPEDRQAMITYYVDQIIGRIVERPYDSIPQLFQYAVRGGPCLTPADVLRLFGGRIIFCRTCRRMNLIRRAALNNEMETIPVNPEIWTGWGQQAEDSPNQDHRDLWCPHLDDPELYWYEVRGMEEEICRYPTVLGTDEFFQETENESDRTDAGRDYSVDSGEWFGVLGPVDVDVVRFWEATNDNVPSNSDAEVSEDGSSDEDWRRPPRVNTSGLEWYYE